MSTPQPCFIDSAAGPILVVAWEPDSSPSNTLLIVPPFAEEMNKSRPLMAALARRLASKGWAVILPDLHGTGDSAGDFAEARYQHWQADLLSCREWAAERGWSITALLGIRFGALLAARSSVCLPDLRQLLFWQPVLIGEAALAQLLRVRIAAAMMQPTTQRESVSGLLAMLAAGTPVESAGYEISPDLASALRAERLCDLPLPAGLPVCWLEIVNALPAATPPPVAQVLEQWALAGHPLIHRQVKAEPFWTSSEISVNPAILEQTLERLDG